MRKKIQIREKALAKKKLYFSTHRLEYPKKSHSQSLLAANYRSVIHSVLPASQGFGLANLINEGVRYDFSERRKNHRKVLSAYRAESVLQPGPNIGTSVLELWFVD